MSAPGLAREKEPAPEVVTLLCPEAIIQYIIAAFQHATQAHLFCIRSGQFFGTLLPLPPIEGLLTSNIWCAQNEGRVLRHGCHMSHGNQLSNDGHEMSGVALCDCLCNVKQFYYVCITSFFYCFRRTLPMASRPSLKIAYFRRSSPCLTRR